MKIVVIGGTGLIGSKVVEKLKHKGHEAIAAAPNTGVNTITGEGLADALAGAQVVVDVANSPSHAPPEFQEQLRATGLIALASILPSHQGRTLHSGSGARRSCSDQP